MSFLSIQGLSKTYAHIPVVNGLTLDIARGEFISLLGPSGCGKTTTLQMIAGFIEPSAGTVSLDGKDITKVKPNLRGLGVVFQSYALFPHMTVAQNVAFGLQMRRISRSNIHDKVQQILALVRLDHLAQRYPRELSGGQRQRVALARALVIDPPVLLLDEPLSNLDAKLREDMQFELRRIQQQVGTTTIMVTHDQSEALSISDRVVVMENGRATQIDCPYTMYEHPQTSFISSFLGKTNTLLARVVSANEIVIDHTSDTLMVDTHDFPINSSVTCVLRPEKITLSMDGGLILGTVSQRYFMGSQWLYYVQTSWGAMHVIVQNDGAEPYPIDSEVDLHWVPQAIRLLPAGVES